MKSSIASVFQCFCVSALSRARTLFQLSAFRVSAFVLLALAPGASAASITFGSATTISGDTDVNTGGTLKYAYTWGAGDTVNGVAFTASSSTTAAGSDITLANYASVSATACTSSSNPFSGLTTAYKHILVGQVYKSGSVSTGTITLNNLTSGHAYLVQIWVNDPRSTSGTRTETVTTTGGNTVTLNFNSSNAEGSPGQYVVGTFTADAATQVISVTSGTGNVDQINAIQVRDQGAAITFGTPANITGDTDVNTSGTLKYAYTWGATADTVNGVAFTQCASFTAAGSDIALVNYTATNSGSFNSSSSPFSGLTTAYQHILKGSVYKSGSVSTGTITLNNLTSGNTYLVQIWVNDPRATSLVTGSSRTETVTTTGGNSVTLNFNSTAAEGGSGQYVIGIFTANATTQVINVSSGTGNVDQINAIQVRDQGAAASGTWNTTTTPASWGTAANWTSSTIANGSGSTADFSTLDITADTTVNLDAPRIIGNLTFGDTTTSSAAGWTLANNSVPANLLVLAGTTPTVTVNALGTGKSATISAIIAGTAGLTKAGAGTLVLSGNNTFTGNVTVNSVANSILTVANSGALGTGSKTVTLNGVGNLYLDGTGGAISLASGIQFNITGNGIYGIHNVAGNNTINGIVGNPNGNGSAMVSSDGGTLTLAGTVKDLNSGAHTIVFNGNSTGANTVSGQIIDGVGAFAVTKSGSGTWLLSNNNTYTGATTVSGGKLLVATGTGTRCTSAVTINNTAGCIFGVQLAGVNGQWASSSTLTVSGASSELDVDFNGFTPSTSTSQDPIQCTTLTVSGTGTLKVLNAGAISATGTYPLINGTAGVPTAADPYTGLTLSLPAGITGHLTTTANQVNLVVTAVTPTISTSGSLTAMSTTYGTASTAQSFTVSGANMGAGITVAPPAGFEVSATSSTTGFQGSGTAITVGGAGIIGSTTIWVRLAATAGVSGTYNSQNISLTSSGATTVNITTASSGNTVSPKALTVSGLTVNAKMYDGSTTATLSGTAAFQGTEAVGSGTASDGKPYSADSVTPGGTAVGAFNSSTAGTAVSVNVTGVTVTGTGNGNYTVTQPTLSADILTTATWTSTTSGGNWSTVANWYESVVGTGSGNTADFSTLTLSGNTTVHLNAPQTIGNLIFGDVGTTYGWTCLLYTSPSPRD